MNTYSNLGMPSQQHLDIMREAYNNKQREINAAEKTAEESKQANDKLAIMNAHIKTLERKLEEECVKRELLEEKFSKKEKLQFVFNILIALITGISVLFFEHFILPLF